MRTGHIACSVLQAYKEKYMRKFLSAILITVTAVIPVISFSTTSISAKNTSDINNSERLTEYTINDLRNLQDFLLNRKTVDLSDKDYDLDNDDKWNVFDLALMKQKLIKANKDMINDNDKSNTEIEMTFGNVVINAVMDNSETTSAFLESLPITLEMNRYADREYYAAIPELPENGEAIPDFENGDITYYTSGRSLAIFFGNADKSSQGDLIRMGKITSDLTLFDHIPNNISVTISKVEKSYDFSEFSNVEITGVKLSDFNNEELSVLYQQAKYCHYMIVLDCIYFHIAFYKIPLLLPVCTRDTMAEIDSLLHHNKFDTRLLNHFL